MRPPAFQFYARDWLSSTLGMPWDVAGVYIHLLAWSWDNGPLPDDPQWRQRVIGRYAKRTWNALQSRWVLTPDGWQNPRLELQRSELATYQKRAQKAASVRWQASIKHGSSIAQASSKHVLDRCTASASAFKDLNTPAASRPVRTTAEFKIYAAVAGRVLAETADLGLAPSEVAEELKRACAKEDLPYDATIIQKAMDAARAARSRKRA